MNFFRKILIALCVPRCRRCDGLHLRKRGSMITAQGPVPEDEGGGLFIESEPTCCLPDEAQEWIMEP